MGSAATVGLSASALAADCKSGPSDIPSIRLADAFNASLAEAPGTASFEGTGMTGTEVLAQLGKNENLAALFCAPGFGARQQALLSSLNGRVGQVTEPSTDATKRLKALKIKPPKPILNLD